MRPRSGKHPKQIGSDASNLITVPITPYNGTAVQNVSIGLINCQSICNKSDEISDVVKDMDLDALVITETWLTGNVSDQKIVGDVTPAGYSFHHAARIHKKGGGVGILLRDSLKCETHLRFQAKSFENYQLTFISGGISVCVAIIYRLHPAKKNGLKAADFFKEFSVFVDSLASNSGHLLILGDFNIHWDCQRNADTKQLADIRRSANLRQHVQERTHRQGHILDLVISRDDDNLIKGVSVSSMLSDHFLVDINVSLQKQSVSAKDISYRRYKSIDKEAFLADLRVSSLVLDPPDDVDHLVDLYDNTLRDIVDQHAPLRTKEMPSRPMLPWYNKNIQAAKRHRRYCHCQCDQMIAGNYHCDSDGKCVCNDGCSGSSCSECTATCNPNPCKNAGRCQDSGIINCCCRPGFGGKYCENKLPRCDRSDCSNHGECYKTTQSHICVCDPGYYGKTRENIPDAFNCPSSKNIYFSDPAPYQTKCSNVVHVKLSKTSELGACRYYMKNQYGNSELFQEGKNGHVTELTAVGINNCQDGDCGLLYYQTSCFSNPCQNGGYCLQTEQTDNEEDYVCRCKFGFTGKYCEKRTLPANRCVTCSSSNPEDCDYTKGAVVTGDHDKVCQIQISCENNANTAMIRHCQCDQMIAGNYHCDSDGKCVCNDGCSGSSCSECTATCNPNPCKNAGRCQDSGIINCCCRPGFGGKYCENKLPRCDRSDCSNHGECYKTTQSHICVCDPGYYGKTRENIPDAFNCPSSKNIYFSDPAPYQTKCSNVVHVKLSKTSELGACRYYMKNQYGNSELFQEGKNGHVTELTAVGINNCQDGDCGLVYYQTKTCCP
ncbi:hypothetical protein LSH36_2340g00003, partial [Paralvinella palmiformis]